ncbi:hypothetical protein [Desulforamulus ferrireducens]|nr:hypothetical protein [Desulforamulus ferrireducens]
MRECRIITATLFGGQFLVLGFQPSASGLKDGPLAVSHWLFILGP